MWSADPGHTNNKIPIKPALPLSKQFSDKNLRIRKQEWSWSVSYYNKEFMQLFYLQTFNNKLKTTTVGKGTKFSYIKVRWNLNFSKFLNFEIALNFWDFIQNFCMSSLKASLYTLSLALWFFDWFLRGSIHRICTPLIYVPKE